MLKTRASGWSRQARAGLIAAATGGFLLFACQGPDEYFRTGNIATGTGGFASNTGGSNASGGSTALAGTAGSAVVSGTGGVAATGGVSGLAGGSSTGTGGAAGRSGGAGGATGGGGTSSRGGISGTAGASGAAGGRGAAGTSGGGGAGGAGSCANCKLVIDAACQDGTNPKQGKVVVDVVNNASTGLPLSQVTFRYWFQLGETTDPPLLTVDYAMLASSTITSKFVAVSPPRSGANEYFEVGFTSKAPTLALFSDSGQIQLRFNAMNFSAMFLGDQTMDYSFQVCPAGASPNVPPYNPNPHITGYINGVLVYGTEPM
ncbi:MAG TPA: cellulose binding domain-containing protein [Polyangia bacterium]|nr:cellulose binding domain-containing protein [Polyangia bacterium]